MARIGFLIVPGHGHVPPSVALARALQARGHLVVYYTTEHFRELLEREGIALVPMRLPAGRGGVRLLGRYGRILDSFGRLIDVTVRELPDRLREDGVELLVVDQAVVTGRTVAELLGLPFVTFIPGLPMRRDRRGRLAPLFAPWPPASGPLGRLRNRLAFRLLDTAALPFVRRLNRRRRERGLRPHRRLDDTFSDDACLTQVPAVFEPDGIDSGRPFHLLGPLTDLAEAESRQRAAAAGFPWERLEGRPILYVSFGTAAPVPMELYRVVLDGSAGLGWLRVVSFGGRSVPPDLARLEDGETLIVSFAPQVALLRRAEVVVTHAGLNTVLESLLLGKPMLAVPLCDDQPGVAARLAWRGAGLVLPARKASAGRVRSALRRLRDDRSYRERALALGREIAQGEPAQRAAEVVEGVARKAGRG